MKNILIYIKWCAPQSSRMIRLQRRRIVDIHTMISIYFHIMKIHTFLGLSPALGLSCSFSHLIILNFHFVFSIFSNIQLKALAMISYFFKPAISRQAQVRSKWKNHRKKLSNLSLIYMLYTHFDFVVWKILKYIVWIRSIHSLGG